MLLSLKRIPAWMVALIIAREVGVTSLRIAAARDGIIMESSRLAKYKTAFQLVAVVALLVHYTYAGINFHQVGMLMLWIALFVTLWSGVIYFIRFFKKTLRPSREGT
jgi:CDP-diacylglycerol--glycerol-3-phosphate 3-phosphatidyltransferase